jgi:hypothetical protein
LDRRRAHLAADSHRPRRHPEKASLDRAFPGLAQALQSSLPRLAERVGVAVTPAAPEREEIMQQAVEILTNDPFVADDSPIVTPFVREQLEDLIGGVRSQGAGAPERALMQAMLQDAVLCLMRQAAPTNERPQLYAEARAWVESRSRAWVFSFESICDALGISPDYARRRLLAIADQPVEETAGGRCALHSLRKGGGRRRKAIHFIVQRRRRAVAE